MPALNDVMELKAFAIIWSLFTAQFDAEDIGPAVILIWPFPVTKYVCSMGLQPVYMILVSVIVQNFRGRSLLARTKNTYLPDYNPARETGCFWAGVTTGVLIAGLLVLVLVDGAGDSTTFTIFLNSYKTLLDPSLSFSLNSLPTIETVYLMTLPIPFTYNPSSSFSQVLEVDLFWPIWIDLDDSLTVYWNWNVLHPPL